MILTITIKLIFIILTTIIIIMMMMIIIIIIIIFVLIIIVTPRGSTARPGREPGASPSHINNEFSVNTNIMVVTVIILII